MNRKVLQLLAFAFSAATLSADAPLPSQPVFKQSEPLPDGHYPAAYNAPSQVKLLNSENKSMADLFVTPSFLYYHADEEGLDIGTGAALVATGASYVLNATSNSQVAFQDFDYKPGFKVGIGGRFCEWTLEGDYTWIRQTTHTQRDAPDPDLAGAIGVWVLDDWFQQLSSNGQPISASQFSSKWHLAIDMADVTLSRPFYQGQHLSVAPSFGLKATWIRQTLKVGMTIPPQVILNQSAPETVSRNASHSWALGPEAGLDADLFLGKGFRVQGNAGASLLYTSYTHVKHIENVASSTALVSSLSTNYKNYNCIRPVAELGLGLVWGSYFCSQKCHIDFAATYDFMVFWDQNMMRQLVDSAVHGIGSAAGNLNLHGLTFTAKVDF